MKLVVATPLYPPDVGGAACYAKELVTRLATHHQVTLVTYGHIPENVEGVRVVAVDRARPLPLRLLAYTLTLLTATRGADALYVENGPSVELPALVASYLMRIPSIFHHGDEGAAKASAASGGLRGHLFRAMRKRAVATIDRNPLTRPEILPFSPYPEEAFKVYEGSWSHHLEEIESALTHVA